MTKEKRKKSKPKVKEVESHLKGDIKTYKKEMQEDKDLLKKMRKK